MSEQLLKMENITKAFAGVKALDNIKFELNKGEVHALMGENGAGKSTLMKILTGVYVRDSGKVFINGKEVEYSNPKEAQNDGVVIVHQELNMMKDLTVAENIFIGRESIQGKFLINDDEMVDKARKLFSRLGVNINPNQRVGELTVGNQQMVEIAKAISMDAQIIVFDEPTAALSTKEIEDLFKIIRDLKQQGLGIVYISHRMDEIGVITDKITVMRDGEYVGTVPTETTSREELIRMMVGRTLKEEPKQKSNVSPESPIVLEVKKLNVAPLVKDISFKLRKGEILGFAGLMGAGRTETARAIFGADRIDSGSIYLDGEEVKITNTNDAVEKGIAYISEDRRRYGILTEMSIAENTVLPSMENFTRNGLIDNKEIYKVSEEYRKSMRVKSTDSSQLVKNLSGGNQQKVVISKWLVADSNIIILDEPTRGIDIGAKDEVYKLIEELATMGKSIIMISSEMSEVLRLSDRIIVLCEGRKTGELSIEEATQEKIMTLATTRYGDDSDE